LQVTQELLVQVPELVSVARPVEVDLVDPVDHLPQQGAALHVVVRVLEHPAHHRRRVARAAHDLELLERREERAVDKLQQRVAREALVVGRPRAPPQGRGDRRRVPLVHELALLVAVVEDLEEEQPAELTDALRVAVHADVLAHDVLNGLDRGAERHGTNEEDLGGMSRTCPEECQAAYSARSRSATARTY